MKKCNKQLVEMAESIEDLATMVCGHGYYAYHNDDAEHPIPKGAVQEFLEMGEAFAKQQMMKSAVDAEIVNWGSMFTSVKVLDPEKAEAMIKEKFGIGDKVKLIIIKED